MHFYQDCSLNNNNVLFIWGSYDASADRFIIHTRVVADVKPTSYTFRISRVNDRKIISFTSDSFVVIATEEHKKVNLVSYAVKDDSSYQGVYRACKMILVKVSLVNILSGKVHLLILQKTSGYFALLCM